MFHPGADGLSAIDPELAAIVRREHQRQEQHIELIASENYTSPAVMQVQGSQLSNQYAAGYPGRRYCGGCEFGDQAEQLALDRLKRLLGAYVHGWGAKLAAAFAVYA